MPTSTPSGVDLVPTNYWTFDNQLLDSISGQSLSPQPVNVSFVADRAGNSNGAVSLTNGNYLTMPVGVYFSGDFTITAWVSVQSESTYATLVDCGTSVPGQNDVVVMITGPQNPKLFLNIGSQDNFFYYPNAVSYDMATWAFLAVTLEASTGTGTTYVNGAQVSQATYPILPTVTRTNCYIGLANWLSPDAITTDAFVDDLAIYNRVLASDELAVAAVSPFQPGVSTTAADTKAATTAAETTATKTSTSTSTKTSTITSTKTSTSTSTKTAAVTSSPLDILVSLGCQNLWTFNQNVNDRINGTTLTATSTSYVADRAGAASSAIYLQSGVFNTTLDNTKKLKLFDEVEKLITNLIRFIDNTKKNMAVFYIYI